MANPFFLTRQSAKLMEDFERELNSGASLFLLHGESAVGKTRLLEELKHTRLGDSKVHWIDLKAGGSGDGALVDSSVMVEDIFAAAQPGDIVIADHFEMALQKTRHQLFLSWSTDGVEKRINLIIGSNSDLYEELRQLAKRYQVHPQSFRMMPLGAEETLAFLGFYLFPDRPVGKLSIQPLVQNQLASAHGAVGKLIEIAQRAGDQITNAPLDDVETERKDSNNMIGVLVGAALVAGLAWYYLSSPMQGDGDIVTENNTRATLQNPASGNDIQRDQGESLQQALPADADQVEPQTAADSEVGAPAEVEPAVFEMQGEEIAVMMGEPGTASDTEAVLIEESALQLSTQSATDEPVEETAQTQPEKAAAVPAGRLDSELQSSLDWIYRSDSKAGTIQIMLLAHGGFDERVYYDYVDYLETQGVEPSALKIFVTRTRGKKVYSVVYGEYESWKAAGNAIEKLPKVLRDASPIPRSAGGLLEEIERLQDDN